MTTGKLNLARDRPVATERIAALPLYGQVKAVLVRRLVEGVWAPGAALPSEGQLAAEIGVSQGTVRKALDELAAENLVVRRQGRGTFVTEHDDRRLLFQFFKLVGDDGERRYPESTVLGVAIGAALAAEGAALALGPGPEVIRIRRLRTFGGAPVIVETVTLPSGLFPGLADGEIPNNLYSLFASRYGVTVASARERLKAVALAGEEASALGVADGTPALRVERIGLSLGGVPVELRVSLCLTAETHYLSDLR